MEIVYAYSHYALYSNDFSNTNWIESNLPTEESKSDIINFLCKLTENIQKSTENFSLKVFISII